MLLGRSPGAWRESANTSGAAADFSIIRRGGQGRGTPLCRFRPLARHSTAARSARSMNAGATSCFTASPFGDDPSACSGVKDASRRFAVASRPSLTPCARCGHRTAGDGSKNRQMWAPIEEHLPGFSSKTLTSEGEGRFRFGVSMQEYFSPLLWEGGNGIIGDIWQI